MEWKQRIMKEERKKVRKKKKKNKENQITACYLVLS